MKYSALYLRSISAAAVAACLITTSAQAGTPLAARGCVEPALSQPFLSIGDRGWYSLAPGQTVDNFDGTGWTLTGGAKIVSTTLADGAFGTVLELPSGATATSPAMCVTNDYPFARSTVRRQFGQAGVSVYVDYGSGAQPSGALVGYGHAWTTTHRIGIHPGGVVGWQTAQFTFVGARMGTNELYNFWVDPRMHR